MNEENTTEEEKTPSLSSNVHRDIETRKCNNNNNDTENGTVDVGMYVSMCMSVVKTLEYLFPIRNELEDDSFRFRLISYLKKEDFIKVIDAYQIFNVNQIHRAGLDAIEDRIINRTIKNCTRVGDFLSDLHTDGFLELEVKRSARNQITHVYYLSGFKSNYPEKYERYMLKYRDLEDKTENEEIRRAVKILKRKQDFDDDHLAGVLSKADRNKPTRKDKIKGISQNFTDSSTAAKDSKNTRAIEAKEQKIAKDKALEGKIRNTPLEESLVKYDSDDISEQIENANKEVASIEKEMESLQKESHESNPQTLEEIVAESNAYEEKMATLRKQRDSWLVKTNHRHYLNKN